MKLSVSILIISLFTAIKCDKEVLLDRSSQDSASAGAAEKVWEDFKTIGTKGKTKHGWQWGGKNGMAVCDTEVEGAENWVRTPFIALDDAKIVKIRIWYNQEKCSRVEEKSSPKCDNKITVSYLHRSNASPDDKTAYKPLDSFLGGGSLFSDTKLEESSQDDAFLYEAQIDLEKAAEQNFGLTRTISDGGIYLAFMDRGSCTVIHSIKVFYYFCPRVVKDFTLYPRTTSSSSSSPVFGSCQPGATSDPERQPKALCNNAGGWDHLKSSQDKCLCDAGYESKNDERVECSPCPGNMYKPDRSSDQCSRCPLNSMPDDHSGATKCVCNHGYYPPPPDYHDPACQQPPPPPVRPSVMVENTVVTIDWSDPVVDSWFSGRKFWYRVQCERCPTNVQTPTEVYESAVRLSGLAEFTRYAVRIFTENTLTMHNPNSAQSVLVEFETKNKAEITNFEVKAGQDNTIHLSWTPEPISMEGGFKVISMFNNEHQSEQEVSIAQYTMRHVAPGPWNFKVCSTVQQDVCSVNLSFEVQGDIGTLPLELSPKHLVITASMIMAIILLMLVILILAVYCYRRSAPLDNSAMWNKSQRSMHLLDVSPNYYSQTDSTYGLKSPFGQSFVDPKFCDDPEKVLYEFTREIPMDQLEIIDSQKICSGMDMNSSDQYISGSFGRALLHTLDDQRIELVTKKCDLMGVGNTAELRNFASEAAVASQFNDPNVLMVYGVAYGPTEAFMCYEVAHKGNLLSFVRESCDKLTSIQLVHLLRGISCGMQYLSDLGYCHKVLISENVAVNSSGICKIAGFDMRTALEVEDSTGSTAKIAKYLTPWSSPEVVAYKKYSSASDVYSFATVIWEIFSKGSSPHLAYPKSASTELIDASSGLHHSASFMLSIPEGCPEAISELMSACWNPDKASRPTFRQIRETLDNIVRHPLFINQPFNHTLMYQAQQQYTTLGQMAQRNNQKQQQQQQQTATEQMLRSLKLEKQYLSLFLSNNIIDQSDLMDLTEETIGLIGVGNNKHKKKIWTYIESMKKQNQSKYIVTSNTFKNSPVNMLV
ncbi:ephrin type-B receptor 1-B-like [Convolutriloba macropyga]|uniref:ephrin type-B receptor 1-B-like n=1 Tax=Convolutriloba macropyga TaxID=536237 RepID=UPI003F523F85